MKFQRKRRLVSEEYVNGVLSGNVVLLSRAITLIESRAPEDEELAIKVMESLLPYSGNSVRIGVTGVPGVGKSTFIDALGNHIIAQGKKIAVLAIDPSSKRTGGSILGDKTRMEQLSKSPMAFIRPTAAGSTLGGVAGNTHEVVLLCEAAGFDVIIIETVGVGQSEVAVDNLSDFFLLLMLAGAGDELQGLKKGIIEMADALAFTKDDGDNKKATAKAKLEFEKALHLITLPGSSWIPRVVSCSALEDKGIREIWDVVNDFISLKKANGEFESKRNQQLLSWMDNMMMNYLKEKFLKSGNISLELNRMKNQILKKELTPRTALNRLFNTLM